VDTSVDAFDADGVAKPGVAAGDEGKAVCIHAYIGTRVHKAESSGRKKHQGNVCRGRSRWRFQLIRGVTRCGIVVGRPVIALLGGIGVKSMEVHVERVTEFILLTGGGQGRGGGLVVLSVLCIDKDRLENTDLWLRFCGVV
jgi:hypothetical protein